MAGIRDDLILDITQAQRAVDHLEAQVTSSFSSLAVGVDTAGVSREISAAVDAADTNLKITSDTVGVSSEITSAVEAADSNIKVTADTAGVAGEITSAVNLADTNVQVNADTSAATAEVAALDAQLENTKASAIGLGSILTVAVFAGGARGLFSLAEAASAVNEQISGSQVVFHDAAKGVQEFSEQADSIGLSETAALKASNAFGQLAMSAGLAQDQADDFATTIVARAADIASLRDLDLDQTLEAIRSGLVGETEPLRNLGIFLNDATVSTEAYKSGIAEVGTQLTDAQKIQARYNQILTQSDIAAGDFARTSSGLANTQRQLSAEFQNLEARAGQAVEPFFLSLATQARDDLLPTLEELATDALPALGSILESLSPILGVTLNLIEAGVPFLQLTADTLELIPTPLLAAVGSYIAFNKAQKLATSLDNIHSLERMASGVGQLNGAFGGLDKTTRRITVTNGAILAIAAIGASGAGDDVGALAGSIVKLGDSFTGFGDKRAKESAGIVKDLVGGLDTSKMDEAQLAVGKLHDELVSLGDINSGRLFSLGDVNVFRTNDAADRRDRAEAIQDQIAALQDQARNEVRAGIDTGRFTQAQIQATKAQAEREGGVSPIIRQLDLLQQKELAEQVQAKQVISTYGELAESYVDIADKSTNLARNAPAVAGALRGIRTGTEKTPTQFLDLATAIDAADLSADDMATTAALLGTDVDSLSGFVDSVTTSLNDFVDAAVQGLPTVSGVLGEVQQQVQDREAELAQSQDRAARDVTASVGQFAKGLEDKARELADFHDDLERLTTGGFADLAGLLAEQGFDAGNAFADELRSALDHGNLSILNSLRTANNDFKTESQETIDFITNDLAPQYLSATGLLASAITESFGSGLDFEEKTRIAGELAKTELSQQGQAIAAVAAVEGDAAAQAYGKAIGLDQKTIDAAIRAGAAIRNHAPLADAAAAGQDVGFTFMDSAIAAFNNIQKQQELEDAAASAAASIPGGFFRALEMQSPSKVAIRIGGHFMDGLSIGIDQAATRPAMAAQSAALTVASSLAAGLPSFAVRPEIQTVASSGGAGRLHPDDIAALAAALAGAVPAGGDTFQITEAGSPRGTARAIQARRDSTPGGI